MLNRTHWSKCSLHFELFKNGNVKIMLDHSSHTCKIVVCLWDAC